MLSSASSASLPSSHSLSLSSGLSAPSRAHSSYPAPAAGGAILAAPVAPPSTHSATNGTAVPVWRSVGEKSALRGYLTTLGVTPEASLTDIRGAYKKLALQWHPDRSDAPNARLKFQEISQAYMALCVEEGDSQEVDVALYEKSTQMHMQKGEQQYAPGLAGVTAGLAGVYSGSNGFYSHLNLPSQSHKANCNSLLHPSNASHLDLYHPHTHSPPTHNKHLNCSCLGSAGLHTHGANCQCQLHSHAHSNGVHGGAVTKDAANSGVISELDVASAVQADLATSGVLSPPLVNVQANSVQVSIYPLPNATVPVVYQVQLKIKKTYQLVWQSPIHPPSAAQQHQLLTYTVPNLVPGTKYLFRVRACPVLASGAALGAALDSDDDPDGLDEIISDVADEATGLGVYSQPSTATTLGNRPEGNAPHPPVLSNLQLAALKKRADKGSKKQQQEGKKKPAAAAVAPNTPLSGSQQAKAAAASSAPDSEDDKSSPAKPNGKQKKTSPSPSGGADSHTSLSRDEANNEEVDTEAESLASTPKRSLTRASSSDLHTQAASATVSAPSTPSTSSAAAVAAASSALATSGRKLSKKETQALKEAKKAAEEERRRLEAESAQAKKLADEVAYQAYILEKRLEADRVRMEEEQRELEKYAQLKLEQDNKRNEESKKAAQAEEQNGGRKRGGKKNQNQNQQTKDSPAAVATASAPLLPTPPVRGKGKQAVAAAVVAPVVASAAAPILHIKLRPDAAVNGKGAQATKDALLPTPASHEPTAVAADKKGGRKGRESKEAASASASVALAAQMAAAAPVAAALPIGSASKPAWSLPSPALAPVAHSTPPSKPRDSPAAVVPITASPIIKAKLPGAKAWTNVASPASPAVQPIVSSSPLQLSSHSPTFVPTSVSAAAAAANAPVNRGDSLLSEHLNRFDATKPWQADQLLLYQQEQQRLREQQEQQQLQMQQAQRQHEQLMRHHAHQQSSAPHDPTSRFHHIAAYTASHSLLSGGGSLHSSLASTVSDRSSGLDSSSLSSSVVGWPEDDHHDALDDLAHELERERWQATEHAQVAAQWNNTANTTVTSAAPSAGLHFTPLSSLRSDSLSNFGSSGASSVFMPPVTATRPPLPNSSSLNDYASRSSNDALGPALGSTASYQLQAQLASSNGGLGLNSFSTHGFPSASGLSRAAPTFTPSSLVADEAESSVAAPLAGAPSVSGHTRRPLPSSTREPATPAVTSGLFSSFALPSFSSFSSNAFGAAPITTSSAGSLNTDWSMAHASARSLVDDSDADLFSSRGSHGMQSALNVPHDHDDVTLIPGTFGGNSSLGSSWLNGLAQSKPQPMFSSAANDWRSHQ